MAFFAKRVSSNLDQPISLEVPTLLVKNGNAIKKISTSQYIQLMLLPPLGGFGFSPMFLSLFLVSLYSELADIFIPFMFFSDGLAYTYGLSQIYFTIPSFKMI
jgi:hypothetical protein